MSDPSLIERISEAVEKSAAPEMALASLAIWEADRAAREQIEPGGPDTRFVYLFALVLDEWCRAKGPITR